MKKVKVVIGANFGDEGKGLMTDYFCSQVDKNKRVLNIRFNGGAQAGHTTCVGSKRHMFKSFGSGSFNDNCDTYLSSFFILNPIWFKLEWDELVALGITPNVYVDKDCMFSVPSDMFINQIAEAYRGDKKHGSCGYGIWETVRRNEDYQAVTISSVGRDVKKLKALITDILKNYTYKRINILGIEKIPETYDELLEDSGVIEHYIEDYLFMLDKIKLVDKGILKSYENLVFEGAQGLLLDKDNKEYYPNISASSTGLRNVISILDGLDDIDIEVCYTTRSYFTRHGAGRFITECDKDSIKEDIVDNTNVPNMYQGIIRYGYFDKNTFMHAIAVDALNINLGNYNHKDITICISHMDETQGKLKVGPDKYVETADLGYTLSSMIKYESYGADREDIKQI